MTTLGLLFFRIFLEGRENLKGREGEFEGDVEFLDNKRVAARNSGFFLPFLVLRNRWR
jgi:hypothetical protein